MSQQAEAVRIDMDGALRLLERDFLEYMSDPDSHGEGYPFAYVKADREGNLEVCHVEADGIGEEPPVQFARHMYGLVMKWRGFHGREGTGERLVGAVTMVDLEDAGVANVAVVGCAFSDSPFRHMARVRPASLAARGSRYMDGAEIGVAGRVGLDKVRECFVGLMLAARRGLAVVG